LALLAPQGHVQSLRLGRALRDTGYHERRLTRLLNAAQGDDFRADLLAAVRWLASHRQGVDMVELADALRSGGTDLTRENIARSFYT
jgi:hypothetical protein